MSVELLRRAATGMRELAQAATPGPWWAAVGKGPKRRNQQVALVGRADMRGQGEAGCIAVLAGLNGRRADDAEHIASWSPAVALAVADVLEHEAAIEEQYGATASTLAVAIAAAFLGEEA